MNSQDITASPSISLQEMAAVLPMQLYIDPVVSSACGTSGTGLLATRQIATTSSEVNACSWDGDSTRYFIDHIIYPPRQTVETSLEVSIDSWNHAKVGYFIDCITRAKMHEDILAALPLLGLPAIAERLNYLHEITQHDDPDEPSMALASLRELALFFVSESLPLGDPEIGIGADGFLQAEWLLRSGGGLAMKFLPTRLIQFAAISKSNGGGDGPLRVHGKLPKYEALDAMYLFIREGCPE